MRSSVLGIAILLDHSIVFFWVMDEFKEGDFLFDMISNGTQSIPFVIDRGNLSGYGAKVTDETPLGYATDFTVDPVHGPIVMGYISLSHPEAEHVVKPIQQGNNRAPPSTLNTC